MKNTCAPLRLLALVLVSSALAPTVAAQKSAAEARSDMEFARGLASRFRYVDLAEEIILGLENERIDKEVRVELGLAKCDIFAEGAKREADPIQRGELYDKAIEAYQEWLEKNPFTDYTPLAQRNYVDLSNDYGRVLELGLDDLLGDEATAARAKIQAVLEDGLALTGDLIEGLASGGSDMTEAERAELARLRLNRGQMLLTLGKIAEEGAFYFAQCEKEFEELALTMGESSGWGLNAYLNLAEAKLAQGENLDAASFAEFVVNVAIPLSAEEREQNDWDQIPISEKERRWSFIEIGTTGLVSAYAIAGDYESACTWGLHMYNTWQREGFTVSSRGYLALLSVARALLDSGGYVGGSERQGNLSWYESEEDMKAAGHSGRSRTRTALDLALAIAQTTNTENKGNTLQIRAQKLISDVISRPGVSVSPAVLYEAAQGEYLGQDFAASLDAFKTILRTLETQDDATRQEYGPKVLYYLARSFDKLGRPLEAAMAHREGVTTWVGDPEFDAKNAKGFYDRIRECSRAAGNPPPLKSLQDEAERLVVKHQEGDKGDILLRQGERLYSSNDYAQAREKYLEVQPGEKVYEKALSKAALCLWKLKDFAAARTEWSRYLTEYVPDPANTPNNEARRAIRSEASAQATFYLGRMAYDDGDYGEAVKWLGGYADKFPGQDGYSPVALYMVTLAHLGEKRFDDAKEVHNEMREKYASHKQTGNAAYKIYERTKQEHQKAEAAGDEPGALALKGQMAEYLQIFNSLASKPNFSYMREESGLWIELESWENAETTLRSTIERFKDKDANVDSIERYVRPDLGLALLMQKKVPEAYDVLTPLVPDPDDEEDKRKPSSKTVRNWCLSVCGWVEGDGRNIVEVPGVGGDSLGAACQYWNELTAAEKNKSGGWNAEWYELKFLSAYGYYQWGKVDSAKTQTAHRTIFDIRQLSEDTELMNIEEATGDDVLRRRYLWLWQKVQ